MLSTKILFLVFIFRTASSLKVKKAMCSFDDPDCVIQATSALYPRVAVGIDGLVEPSDPLTKDSISVNIPDLSLELNKASLYGLHFCEVLDVVMDAKDNSFTYNILCPNLRVEAESYELNGKLDGVPVKGSGSYKINFYNYSVVYQGLFTKKVDDNGDLYIQVVKYTFKGEVERVEPNITGYSFGGITESKSKEYLKELHEALRKPLMNNFMDTHMTYLNKYLDNVPTKDILFKYVKA